jgi:hypothetical protein
MITTESLYDIIRGSIDSSIVPDENIRYAILPEKFSQEENHIIFNFALDSQVPLDLLGQFTQDTYGVTVEIISPLSNTIVSIAHAVRQAIIQSYNLYNVESTGDDEILTDEELRVNHTEIRLQITFN